MYGTLGEMPLKSPTTELLLYENPISNLLYEIRTSETYYRDQLSKLLGCCSPLKKQVSNGFTSSVRKMIAYHTDLVRLLDHMDEMVCIGNFLMWVERVIPVYENYIANYKLDSNNLKLEIQLKKYPFKRINQIIEFFNKIIDINTQTPQFKTQINPKVLQKLIELMEIAKDKNEQENTRIDLSTFQFNKVRSLNQSFSPTAAYFQQDHILKRDYFNLDLYHPECSFSNELVELVYLHDNTIAVCSIESPGRSLMFPPIKPNEFDIISNDDEGIHLRNFEGVELKFDSEDAEQYSYWNGIMEKLFNADEDDEFLDKFENLQTLKSGKIGLGIDVHFSKLRKSSPMISKHNSLELHTSPSIDLLNSPDLKNIENFFTQDLELDLQTKPLSSRDTNLPLNTSPTLPLNIKKSNKTTKLKLDELPNSSTVSLPSFPNTGKSLNLNEKIGGSSIDLSKFDNIKPNFKVKKRKSIFNFFNKKNEEPVFEIVKPNSIASTSNSTSTSTSNSTSTSTSTSSKTLNQIDSNETTIPQTKQSMASLQKNIKNLTISTSTSSIDSKSNLPSPFGKSSTKQISLTPFEESTLSSSTVLKIFKNNTIVSKWNVTQWESIGHEYGNTMKFVSTTSSTRLMVLFHDSNVVPMLMIPIDGSSVMKSSALDVQIKCFSNIEDQRNIILNIRCKDSYTLKQIMNEFEGQTHDLSNSSSDVFSAPSNSTSMSSVSVDEIQELGKPGLGSKFGSTASLGSIPKSVTSTIPACQTLLLKSDVKVKLHKMDEDEEWRPVSLGKFNISSNLGNPQFSNFEIIMNNKQKFETIVKNSNCERLGKSGLKFSCFDELDDDVSYLIEFRNSIECQEIYDMLV